MSDFFNTYRNFGDSVKNETAKEKNKIIDYN